MPQRVSHQAVRQLKPTTLETEVVSTSNPARTSKEKSPKVVERRSPRSPVSEVYKVENIIHHYRTLLNLRKVFDKYIKSPTIRAFSMLKSSYRATNSIQEPVPTWHLYNHFLPFCRNMPIGNFLIS